MSKIVGFTLLELLLVCFFLSVFLVMGKTFAPRLQANLGLSTAASDMRLLIHKARTAALSKRQKTVLAVSPKRFWAFLDKDGNGVFSGKDSLLGQIVFADFSGKVRVDEKTNFSEIKPLRFNRRGILESSSGSIYFSAGGRVWRIVISKNGASRLEKDVAEKTVFEK